MPEPELVEGVEGARLAPQQRRLWLLQEAHGPLAIQTVLEVSAPAAELRAALERSVARHDALRTSFHAVPGMRVPVQATEATEGNGGLVWREIAGDRLS